MPLQQVKHDDLRVREKRHARLMKELQLSGAFFKCSNCRDSSVKLEMPCSVCESLNCKTDEKNKMFQHEQEEHSHQQQMRRHRRKQSNLSETSWDSSDLNTEYQRSHRLGANGKVYSSKLLECSNELIAN